MMSEQRSLKDRIRLAIRIEIANDDVVMRDLLLDTLYEIKALESRVRGGNDYHTPECLVGESEGLEYRDWGDRHAC
jgi:hypothetical protein